MSGIETFIQRRSDKELVSATVLEGMAATDLLVVENEWRAERSLVMQELLAAGVARPNWPESLHWDWSRKVSELQLLASTGFGIVCEKRWQGVITEYPGTVPAFLANSLININWGVRDRSRH